MKVLKQVTAAVKEIQNIKDIPFAKFLYQINSNMLHYKRKFRLIITVKLKYSYKTHNRFPWLQLHMYYYHLKLSNQKMQINYTIRIVLCVYILTHYAYSPININLIFDSPLQ